MSRKDPRRAIAVQFPPEVWQALRARQARSRGRRLMDTVRVVVANALPGIDTWPVPPEPGGPRRALQLPRQLRARVADLAKTTGLSEAQIICVVVTRAVLGENPTPPLSKD